MEFDWKALVRTVAPTIASVFGTPLAGLGVTALLNAILPEGEHQPEKPEEFLAQAMASANPEVMGKIRAAEQAFLLDMKRLDIDVARVLAQYAAENTKGARELKTTWLNSEKWDYEPVLALLVACSFGYAEWWVFAHTHIVMDAGASVLIGRVLGTVDAAFMLLLSFRWGTSHSSERKTEMLADAQEQKKEK